MKSELGLDEALRRISGVKRCGPGWIERCSAHSPSEKWLLLTVTLP